METRPRFEVSPEGLVELGIEPANQASHLSTTQRPLLQPDVRDVLTDIWPGWYLFQESNDLNIQILHLYSSPSFPEL